MPRIPTTVTPRGDGTNIQSQARGPSIPEQKTGNRQIDDLQRQQREGSAPIRSLPFADGNLIADQQFTAGVAKRIEHKLGRPYRGFIQMNLRGATVSALFRPLTSDGDLAKFHITLTASATALFDVWVY